MRIRGFTLLELLVVLSIVVLLLATVPPTFSNVIKGNKSKVVVYNLVALLQAARETAITQNKTVTVCGSSDRVHCDREWDAGILVFVDARKAGKVDPSDRVLRYENPIKTGEVEWRAFQNKPYLQFRHDGFTNFHNGNLTYCPNHDDMRFSKQLIVNVSGRVRIAPDTDGNRIPNSADGDDIEC